MLRYCKSLSLMLLYVLPVFGAVGAGAQGSTAHAQDDDAAAVEAVIRQMFDGMRAGDSTMVRAVLHPDAVFRTMAYRDGAPVMIVGDPDRFVAAVGTPHEKVWDERIWDLQIDVDGPLASAWMQYAFIHGEDLSHCGVNTFQLFRGDDGWKVVHLADTRRREGCVVGN